MFNTIERPGEFLIRAGAATSLSMASLGMVKDAYADSPTVQTGEYQTISQNGVELTQIYKGRGTNKITAEIFLYNYPNFQEGKDAAKKFVEYFFIPYPLSNHLDDYDFWVRNPAGMEDLECEQLGNCNNSNIGAFEREIDRVISATKMIPQETFVLIKSNDQRAGGQGSVAGLYEPPSIYNFVGVVLPTNLISENQKMNPAHEWGARMGFIDSTDRTSIMGNYSARRFNDVETAWIERAFANNRKFSHLTPGLEIISRGGVSSLKVSQNVENLPDLNLMSLINSPEGTDKLKILISPASNKFSGQPDGPDISIYLGSLTSGNQPLRHALTESGMIIREPVMGVGPYVVLPDMTYTWKVCASGLMAPVPWNSEKWEEVEIWPGRKIAYPCHKIEMKTAKTDSTSITPATLVYGMQTNDLTPTVSWNNSKKNIFYYEVQLSADPEFEMDPVKAKAAVYWNLIHGGETTPLNSWTVPDSAKLDPNKTYYWRVRPRIQGDGQEVAWSPAWSFNTAETARAYSVKPDQQYRDIVNGSILYGPSQGDLDLYGAPNPEVKSLTEGQSKLARVIYTKGGIIFIPGAVYIRKEEENMQAAA